ncbi:MAG TPA: elongation factor Ts [Firmicutes bacterium]|nr:elongation factor Ts [Bacillota bacterium]
MSEIIELIKVLRDRTGAGIMDCKRALVANNNDVEASISWLREKGIAKVAKKSSRIAAEGLSTVKIEGDAAVVVEVNCETDFVAHSDDFVALVDECADGILAKRPGCVNCAKEVELKRGSTLEQAFTDATIKLGEKLDLRRFEVLDKKAGQVFGKYIHMKGKISALVLLNGGNETLAKGIAMSVAASNPQYIKFEDIPQEALDKEMEIQSELASQDESFAKKPEEIRKKILSGRVEKILGEQILIKQEYVLDSSKTVETVLKENNAQIVKFVRYQVGEGLEKRSDDFASEVMNQVK